MPYQNEGDSGAACYYAPPKSHNSVEQFMNQYFFLPGDDFSFSEFGCFILPTTRGLSMPQIQWCEKPLLLPTVSIQEGVLEI